jgi:hypothetical protein
MLKTLVTTAAAAALMAGAAHAGEKTMSPANAQAEPPASADTMSTDTGATTSDPMVPAASTGAGAMAGTRAMSADTAGADVSAVVTTTMVTNGPIADTPENRAKYGQPLSRAGRQTAARGN